MSANDEAASSSNGDIITNSDQDAAAEGRYVDSQLYIAAAIKGNIEPFKNAAREIKSIVTPNKNTILHINIMSRNKSSVETASINFVKDILDRNIAETPLEDILCQVNVNAETPLHVAAKYGHSDMVEVLIKSAKDQKKKELESGIGDAKWMLGMINNEGNTALHEAVKYTHLDVVRILTKEDPDFIYPPNNRGETPLYIAAAKKSLEIVGEILETCKSPTYEGPNQMTALHVVAMNFHPDITRKILEKKKSLIKERDQYGWTPLHYAAYHYNSETMKLLLECDVSATYIGDKHRKMTPLHIAIGQGDIPHVLLSRCPDCCELVDERKWNVLHFAMLSLNNELLKVLLKEYPLIRNLINDKDVDGNTPLHFLATFRSHLLQRIKYDDKDVKLDLDVVNNQNISVRGVRKSGSHQLKMKEILKLEEAAGPYRDGVVRVKKESNDQNWWQHDEEHTKEYEKTKESHLIVAGLIATVTFTAAFTIPGGVIQDGDNEGTAILSKKTAFQAFVITDAIAMVLSLSAVFAHFLMSLKTFVFTSEESRFMVLYGASSTMMAMGAMVIAFVTGIYAVLTTSLWLAILTTFIGLTTFLLMFIVWKRATLGSWYQ